MTNETNEGFPMLFVRDGAVMADSRTVADAFEKRRDHVIAAIRDLISKAPDEVLPIFRPFKIKDLSGESTSHYEMTRDGFTLLAMGFTGEKARVCHNGSGPPST